MGHKVEDPDEGVNKTHIVDISGGGDDMDSLLSTASFAAGGDNDMMSTASFTGGGDDMMSTAYTASHYDPQDMVDVSQLDLDALLEKHR